MESQAADLVAAALWLKSTGWRQSGAQLALANGRADFSRGTPLDIPGLHLEHPNRQAVFPAPSTAVESIAEMLVQNSS